VRAAMESADGWFMCRVGYVEAVRAVELAAGRRATKLVRDEWPAIGVVEIDQRLVEHAAALAVEHDLGSLDALHLASALVLPRRALTFATWDRRLHAAANRVAIDALPPTLD
jgi:uncharacterized protein